MKIQDLDILATGVRTKEQALRELLRTKQYLCMSAFGRVEVRREMRRVGAEVPTKDPLTQEIEYLSRASRVAVERIREIKGRGGIESALNMRLQSRMPFDQYVRGRRKVLEESWDTMIQGGRSAPAARSELGAHRGHFKVRAERGPDRQMTYTLVRPRDWNEVWERFPVATEWRGTGSMSRMLWWDLTTGKAVWAFRERVNGTYKFWIKAGTVVSEHGTASVLKPYSTRPLSDGWDGPKET